MHGRYVPVRAEVVQVPDFSVHADADELIAWLARMPAPPPTVYVVHGEGRSAAALARRIHRGAGLERCGAAPRRAGRDPPTDGPEPSASAIARSPQPLSWKSILAGRIFTAALGPGRTGGSGRSSERRTPRRATPSG